MYATTSASSAKGSLWIYPGGAERPSSPTILFGTTGDETVAVPTKLSKSGTVSIYASSTVELSLDTAGWYDAFTFLSYDPTTGAQYHSVTPKRVVDTRVGLGAPAAKLGGGGSLNVQITGKAGVPAGALAAAVSLTVLAPASAGSLGASPTGVPPGQTEVLSFPALQRRTGLSLTRLSGGGSLTILNRGGAANVLVDVMGYYSGVVNDIITGQSTLISPTTLMSATLGSSESVEVSAGGVGHVPVLGAESVFIQVKTSQATANGTLTIWNPETAEPSVTSVSYRKGQTTSALAVAPLSFQFGAFDIRNSGGTVQVTIRAVGWHAFVIPPPPDVPPPNAAISTAGDNAVATSPGVAVGHKTEHRAAARRFWTAERREDARARGEATFGGARSLRAAEPLLTDADFGISTRVSQNGYLPSNGYSDAIGFLYRENPDNSVSSCTATVVARNLLLTAAHCVVDANGNFYDNVAVEINFAPGQEGSTRHSVWVTQDQWVYPNYYDPNGDGTTTGDGTFDPLDFSIIRVGPTQAGYYIGDYTSWYPIYGGYGQGQLQSYGYPSEGWFYSRCNGTTSYCDMYFNFAPVGRYVSYGNGWYDVGMAGYFAGGASGGPVFQWYNGRYYIVSVNSFIRDSVTCTAVGQPNCNSSRDIWYGQTIWGPALNQWVVDLWNDKVVT